MNKLPILIIGFTRVDGIQNLLNSLQIEQISELYVAIDGPRSDRDSEAQIEILSIVREFANISQVPLSLWHRESNLGVAVGVITAVDWFFSNVTVGAILEDDLVVGSSFIPYIIKTLPFLEENEDVLLISGNQFLPNDDVLSLRATYYPQIWGWATTKNKWLVMRNGLLSAQKFILKDFLSPRRSFWAIGSIRALNGTIDTWDLPLARYMKNELKICLIPPVNLVQNNGFDQFASHTVKDQFPLGEPIIELSTDSLIVDPFENGVIEASDNQLEERVFGIRLKHLFSLPIGLLQFIGKKKNTPLKLRIDNAVDLFPRK